MRRLSLSCLIVRCTGIRQRQATSAKRMGLENNVDAERRRWRCSSCQCEYQIPLAADDPMACRQCVGAQYWTLPWQPVPLSIAAPADDPAPLVASATDETAVPEPYESPKASVTEPAAVASRPRAVRRAGSPRRTLAVTAVVVVAGLLITGWLLRDRLGDVASEGTPGPSTAAAERPAAASVPLFVQQPTARCNPNADAPLVAFVDFETDRPVVCSVTIDDGQRRWTYRPIFAASRDHHLAIVGLRAGVEHTLQVQVETPDALASDTSSLVTVTTPPLPDDFPPLETLISSPEKMEPGVTLFAANIWRDNERVYDYGYFIAVDAAGEVIWYCRTGRRTADLRLLNSGHLLYNEAKNFGIFEVDLLGNPIRQWWAANLVSPPNDRFIPVQTDSFHHQVIELPSGNILTLSTELRMTEDFPTTELAPFGATAEAAVVGDVVLEFAKDGTVIDQLSLYDLLDPHRIGYGSLSGFWASHYPREDPEAGSRDWSHANAIVFDPATDSVIVSLRHQDCLVKIHRGSRQVVWILGDPSGWRYPWRNLLLQPQGPLHWPYHQHGPELTPFGTLLMYDNGNYRAIPPEPKRSAPANYSRAVEYVIDEDAQSVKQVWEYGGGPRDERFYSTFYGEADRLPQTGNVLITDGGHIETADGLPSDDIPGGHQWARIIEVTHDLPSEKVFELRMDSGKDEGIGWSMYRSERLPDLSRLSNMATAARAAQRAAAVERPAPPEPAVTQAAL